jgi:hypothetical protein
MAAAGLLFIIKIPVLSACYMTSTIGLKRWSRGPGVTSGLTNLAFSVVSDEFHKVKG